MARRIKFDPITREYLEGNFQARFFESAVERHPENLECLVQLGNIYTRQGRYEEGLEIDSRLTALRPDEPTFFFNLACSYSVLGRCEEAGRALQTAIDLGFDDLEQIQEDDDLENLRKSSGFPTVLRDLFSHE